MRKPALYLTITLVVTLLAFLGIGLSLNPRDVPSPLINQPVPEFSIPDLLAPTQTFSNQDLLGKISLVNVWATWCPSCLTEHEVLLKISKTKQVQIYGIDWKDSPQKAINWLTDLGNPYIKTGSDETGSTGIDFGVYGAPETYLINQSGTIIYKHTGPISWDDWQKFILPKINELNL